jgi:hypothetical protein
MCWLDDLLAVKFVARERRIENRSNISMLAGVEMAGGPGPWSVVVEDAEKIGNGRI